MIRPLAKTVKIEAEITPIVIIMSPNNFWVVLSARFEDKDKTTPLNARKIAMNFVIEKLSILNEVAIIIVHIGIDANKIPALPDVVNSKPKVRQIGKPEK